MANQSFGLMYVIRTMAGAYKDDRSTDGELLSRYAETKDQTAFATLMVRHGPMVWNACRTILGNEVDAEDAYQVTFMALAKQAHKIQVKDTLAGWLCQIARRASLDGHKTKKSRKKLQEHLQTQADVKGASDNTSPTEEDELKAIICEELADLPEKQRVVLVLYVMEGKTLTEIAAILGLTESSVWNRLERGKARLQERLRKKGLALGAVTLTSLLEMKLSQAVPPHRLIVQTMKAATEFHDGKLTGGLAKLAAEVLRLAPSAAPWWKSGWMIAILCVGGLGAGAGGVAWMTGFLGTNADGPAVAKKQETPQPTGKEKLKPTRLDLYGDPLPERAITRLGTTRLRLKGKSRIAFTADGKGLLTTMRYVECAFGRARDSVRLWDVSTGRLLRAFGEDVGAFDLSQDGRILAGRGIEKGSFCLWDFATGRLLRRIEDAKILTNSEQATTIAPDGTAVASLGHGGNSRLPGVWDVETGELIWEPNLKPRGAVWLAYSPDGKMLIAAAEKGLEIPKGLEPPRALESRFERKAEIILWRAGTGKEIRRFEIETVDKEHLSSWPLIACSPDNRTLAVVYEWDVRNSWCCLWDMASGKRLRQLGDPDGQVSALAFSPDGNVLATGDGDGWIHLWDVAAGKSLRRCGGWKGAVVGLTFSPTGKILAAACAKRDQTIHLWDLEANREIAPRFAGHQSAVRSIVFSDGDNEVVSGGDDGVFRVWDVQTGSEQVQWGKSSQGTLPPCPYYAIAPGGKMVAFGETPKEERAKTAARQRSGWCLQDLFVRASEENGSSLRIARQGGDGVEKEVSRIPMPSYPDLALPVTFSLDGRMLAYQGQHPTQEMRVVETATGKGLPHAFAGEKAVFSPDGRILAAIAPNFGKEHGLVGLWDIQNGKRLCVIPNAGGCYKDARRGALRLRTLLFSPDGKTLAVASQDGEGSDVGVLLWRLVEVGKEDVSVRRHGQAIRCQTNLLAFSPDGGTLASADCHDDHGGPRTYHDEFGNGPLLNHEIHLWEIAAGKERQRFQQHEDEVSALAFSFDGRRLASGSEDTTILVWDVTGRLEHGQLRPQRLSEQAMESLWDDLAGADARRAGRTIWTLISGGPPVVSFLAQKLLPLTKEPIPAEVIAKQVPNLIGDLDSNSFDVRNQARRQLAALGEIIEPALRQALGEKPSVEKRANLKRLLEEVENRRSMFLAGEPLRTVRAIEVLEQIDAPDGRRLLKQLAASGHATYEARAALGRLEHASRHTRK